MHRKIINALMNWLVNAVKMSLLLTILRLESFVETGVRDLENDLLTGRRHDGDRRFIKWTRFLVKASWLNIRRKCCKACGTGTQERYCLIQDACAC